MYITLRSCTSTNRGGPVFSQMYTHSCVLLLGLPNKLSNKEDQMASVWKMFTSSSHGEMQMKTTWRSHLTQSAWLLSRQQQTLVRLCEDSDLSLEHMESVPATVKIGVEVPQEAMERLMIWPCSTRLAETTITFFQYVQFRGGCRWERKGGYYEAWRWGAVREKVRKDSEVHE